MSRLMWSWRLPADFAYELSIDTDNWVAEAEHGIYPSYLVVSGRSSRRHVWQIWENWAQLQPSKRLRRCERIRIRRILVALKEPDWSEQSNVSNRLNMLFCKNSIFTSIQLAVFFFLVVWPFSQGQPWQQQSAEDVQIYSKWNFQNKIIYNRNNWEHHDMTVWLRSSIQHTITSVAIHRVWC